MIVNVPVYLDIPGRFNPEDGKQISRFVREAIFDFVRKQSGGTFNLDLPQGRIKVTVISERQALNRFGQSNPVKLSPESFETDLRKKSKINDGF